MADDPGWVYVFPDPATRQRRLEQLFAIVTGSLYVGHDAWHIDDVAGVALWDAPGHRRSIGALVLVLPRLGWLIGRRTAAALAMFVQMERRRPSEPHAYLAALGVDPSRQGRGLGPRLLAPMLERCDRDGRLAWLESANAKNHSFYRRLGFELADTHVVANGPTISFFARRPNRFG